MENQREREKNNNRRLSRERNRKERKMEGARNKKSKDLENGRMRENKGEVSGGIESCIKTIHTVFFIRYLLEKWSFVKNVHRICNIGNV